MNDTYIKKRKKTNYALYCLSGSEHPTCAVTPRSRYIGLRPYLEKLKIRVETRYIYIFNIYIYIYMICKQIFCR